MVGGLVVEIVAAWEPGFSDIVRIFINGNAEIVVDVVVEVESAPSLLHYVLTFAVENGHRKSVALRC